MSRICENEGLARISYRLPERPKLYYRYSGEPERVIDTGNPPYDYSKEDYFVRVKETGSCQRYRIRVYYQRRYVYDDGYVDIDEVISDLEGVTGRPLRTVWRESQGTERLHVEIAQCSGGEEDGTYGYQTFNVIRYQNYGSNSGRRRLEGHGFATERRLINERIYFAEPIDGGDHVETHCEFKVYDYSGQVFHRIAPKCPVVREPVVRLQPAQELDVPLRLGDSLDVRQDSIDGPDRIKFYRVRRSPITDVVVSENLVKQIQGYRGAPDPTWRIRCAPCCPPGTCEVNCGNHRCCYNELGYVLKRC